MKTAMPNVKEIKREWYILDASEAPLGRLSTVAASLLLGKGKIDLSPHIDAGDNVVVINANSMVVTGNKTSGKIYYRHSGFPGGIKQRKLSETSPASALRHAIRGMLPDNKLRDGRLHRLKIYPTAEHKHQGQNPKTVTLKEKS